MTGYWYLGSPYSKYPNGREAAHRDICRFAGDLIRCGVPVYSPIAHTHPIAEFAEIDPYDHDIWLPADKPMMDAACGLIVAKMEGWETSRGLLYEIEVFDRAGKHIVYAATPDEAALLVIPR